MGRFSLARLDSMRVSGFLLSLYTFSLSVENVQVLGLSYFSISKLCALLYVLSSFSFIKFKSIFDKDFYYFWPVACFYVLLVVMSLINLNQYSVRFFAQDVFFNLILFFVIVKHSKIDLYALDNAMFAFAIGVSLVSLFLFVDMGREVNQEGRVTFLNAGLNELGLKFVAGLAVVMVGIGDSKKTGYWRLLLILFVPLLLLAILETGSRTAYAAFVFMLLVFVFIKVLHSEKKAIYLAIVFVVFFVSCFPIISILQESDVFLKRFDVNAPVGYMNLGGRDVLWSGFLSIVGKSSLFGYGLSGYDYHAYQYFGFVESPHNVILEVLLYTGCLGLVVYLLFLYRVFLAAVKHSLTMNSCLSLLLLCVFLGFMMSLQALSEKVCWLILGYTVGTYLYGSDETRSGNA